MEVIIAGDMNDTPDSEPMQAFNDQFESVNKKINGGAEPPFTTHKFRLKDGMVTRTIDYTLLLKPEGRKALEHENKFAIKAISAQYKLPTEADLPETGFPTANYPSDHMAIGLEF